MPTITPNHARLHLSSSLAKFAWKINVLLSWANSHHPVPFPKDATPGELEHLGESWRIAVEALRAVDSAPPALNEQILSEALRHAKWLIRHLANNPTLSVRPFTEWESASYRMKVDDVRGQEMKLRRMAREIEEPEKCRAALTPDERHMAERIRNHSEGENAPSKELTHRCGIAGPRAKLALRGLAEKGLYRGHQRAPRSRLLKRQK